jgi:XRE family transcriptional regulator, regulator of sulfur utilization
MNPRQTVKPQPALGKAIRELRQKRGATLETVAGEAGITLNMLSLIERGEGNPTWATVRGIAAALGVPVSTLAKAAEGLGKISRSP